MVKKNEIDMTSGNLFYKLIIVSIPLILSGLLQFFYNAADLIICGMFGSNHAVAAISSTSSLTSLIVKLFLGLSVGANVLMARCFGQNNQEKGQKVVYTSMVFSLIVGIVVGLFGFFMSTTFLKLMDTPSDVIDLSSIYLKIYFLGLPFLMLYNFGSSILRATGDTKRPFYYLTISGVFNILFNLLFVIVFKMDVAGVAISTVISQAISAILIVISLLKNKGFFEFKLKDIKFYKKEALEIILIGLPAGIQSSIGSFSNVLIQSNINGFGTLIMDGNGAAHSLEGFIYIAMNSIAHSTLSFVSANYGANNKKNIKKVILYGIILVIMIEVLMGGGMYLFKDFLFGLYIEGEEAILAATQRLTMIAIFYSLCGILEVLAYSLRGIGHSILPTIVYLFGTFGVIIFWILVIFNKYHTYPMLLMSYPASWFISALANLLLLIMFFKKIDFNKKIIA